MSSKLRSDAAARRHAHATVLAALGDETRLVLLTHLADGRSWSIASLTEGSRLTRQAITKHLRVMEQARIVRCTRSGRESLFRYDPAPVLELTEYLHLVSHQWDEALSRLQTFVQKNPAD